MKTGYTHIAALLDRSGSMSNIINDMRGGFTTFIDDQRKLDGALTLMIVQFDDHYETLLPFTHIDQTTPVDMSSYQPRGTTALIDSFCKLIDETGLILGSLREADRPEKVLFICITDGEENSSHVFKNEDLAKRIKTQQEQFNWSFVFLGANQDSFATAGGMGIDRGSTMNFVGSSAGVKSFYSDLSKSTSAYRSSKVKKAFGFNEDTDKAEK